MAELRTPSGRSSGEPRFDPPRGDEALDDWFERRLEAQGIRASRGRIPLARILSVIALVGALVALGWIFGGVRGSSSTSPSTTVTHHHKGRAGVTKAKGGTKATSTLWKHIPLQILNGWGGSGAAGNAKAKLSAAGWDVASVADAASPVTQHTIVVYVPGKKGWARVVAARLKLPAPIPISQAQGVLPTQTDGVAIVLGPNGLPSGTGT
jgi:hypothetical protein